MAVSCRVGVFVPEELAILEEQWWRVTNMRQYEYNDPYESDGRYHPTTRLVSFSSFLVVLYYGDKTRSNAEKNKYDVTSDGPFAPTVRP